MRLHYLLPICLFYFICSQAQNHAESIITDFENYRQIPESNIYLHLNKSILVQGEDLGFAAYVYDLKNQKPSEDVKNLYCQILDEQNEVVKEQMLLVNKGNANGIFKIDSLFSEGNYKIRSFTNWMKNFKNPNYFEAPLKILNNSTKKHSSTYKKEPSIQILPEGGYLINDVVNVIGIKTEQIEELESCKIILFVNGEESTEVKLDKKGLGRLVLKVNNKNAYGIEIQSKGFKKFFNFPKIESYGITSSINQLDDKLLVKLKTNEETLAQMSSKNFSIAVNSDNKLSVYKIRINSIEELLAIDIKDLAPGVNQITMFSEERKIINKRLFFNYRDFKLYDSDKIVSKKEQDSVTTHLEFRELKNAHLSVSVLNINNVARDKSQSIAAAFKLNPYLYDNVKDPLYYFTDVDTRKKFEMDNLMLCLGWEMYDWNFIFKKNKLFDDGFENGITVNAKIKKPKKRRFIIYPSKHSEFSFIDVDKRDQQFAFENYYPVGDENLLISELDFKGNAKKTKLSLKYYPDFVPQFFSSKSVAPLELSYEIDEIEIKPFLNTDTKLDTILLEVDKSIERAKLLRDRSWGKIDVFTDLDRSREVSIIQYLNRNMVQASNYQGQIAINNPRQNGNIYGTGDIPVLIVLDGVAYTDPNILQGFNMADVDYIEIDMSGITRYAGQGQNGIIRIKTDPALNPFGNTSKKMNNFEVPLTFSAPVDFFKPTYYSYTDEYFYKLGVVDWQGDLELVDGKASFTMPYLGVDKLLLHVQGWSEDGDLIDEVREVVISQ